MKHEDKILLQTANDPFHKELIKQGIKPSNHLDVLKYCEEILEKVWRVQGMDVFKKLIQSMGRCCETVVASGGGHIK